MTPAESLAHNVVFSSSLRTIFMEPEPGLYALWTWGGEPKLLYLGDSLEELLSAYRLRPIYTPPPRRQPDTLDEIEIDL